MKQKIALLAACVIGYGCAVKPVQQLVREPMVLTLALAEDVLIPAYQKETFIQNGQVLVGGEVQADKPYCLLSFGAFSHLPRQIDAGQFSISRITNATQMPPLEVALLGNSDWQFPLMKTYTQVTFFLLSGQYGDAIRLKCQQVQPNQNQQPILLDQIQATIYPLVTFKMVASQGYLPL